MGRTLMRKKLDCNESQVDNVPTAFGNVHQNVNRTLWDRVSEDLKIAELFGVPTGVEPCRAVKEKRPM